MGVIKANFSLKVKEILSTEEGRKKLMEALTSRKQNLVIKISNKEYTIRRGLNEKKFDDNCC